MAIYVKGYPHRIFEIGKPYPQRIRETGEVYPHRIYSISATDIRSDCFGRKLCQSNPSPAGRNRITVNPPTTTFGVVDSESNVFRHMKRPIGEQFAWLNVFPPSVEKWKHRPTFVPNHSFTGCS